MSSRAMKTLKPTHISVLSQELIEGLSLTEGDVVLDATINGGGHSLEVSSAIGKDGTIIGIDLDSDALKEAKDRLKGVDPRVFFKEGNYRDFVQILDSINIPCFDKAIFDLGMSSRQLDVAGRGFSFRSDEPLIMTYSKNPPKDALTARDIVNTWDEENIAAILKWYGGERYAKRIAHSIVTNRKERAIETTKDLVDIIEEATPSSIKRSRIHPATKTFQALRVTVNDEIEGLRETLTKIPNRITPGGRIAVISFQSSEDRVVKHIFREWKKDGLGMLLTKKPQVPSRKESESNPRSRSAKLRIFHFKKDI